MMLLVSYYTRNVLAATGSESEINPGFMSTHSLEPKKVTSEQELKIARENLKPQYKFWYENRSEFDFNLELFLRHAELWRSHAFSSSSLSFLSVQKEMFEFIAMFVILDESKSPSF